MVIIPFHRKVQYYETDMMGIAHHANYIHWMEEARIDFMDQIGFPYSKMEAMNIFSPVKSLSCNYRKPCTFGDELEIALSVSAFNGVVMVISYQMKNARTGETVCAAQSEHCFLDRDGHFVRLKKTLPLFCDKAEALLADHRERNADE